MFVLRDAVMKAVTSKCYARVAVRPVVWLCHYVEVSRPVAGSPGRQHGEYTAWIDTF